MNQEYGNSFYIGTESLQYTHPSHTTQQSRRNVCMQQKQSQGLIEFGGNIASCWEKLQKKHKHTVEKQQGTLREVRKYMNDLRPEQNRPSTDTWKLCPWRKHWDSATKRSAPKMSEYEQKKLVRGISCRGEESDGNETRKTLISEKVRQRRSQKMEFW